MVDVTEVEGERGLVCFVHMGHDSDNFLHLFHIWSRGGVGYRHVGEWDGGRSVEVRMNIRGRERLGKIKVNNACEQRGG